MNQIGCVRESHIFSAKARRFAACLWPNSRDMATTRRERECVVKLDCYDPIRIYGNTLMPLFGFQKKILFDMHAGERNGQLKMGNSNEKKRTIYGTAESASALSPSIDASKVFCQRRRHPIIDTLGINPLLAENEIFKSSFDCIPSPFFDECYIFMVDAITACV